MSHTLLITLPSTSTPTSTMTSNIKASTHRIDYLSSNPISSNPIINQSIIFTSWRQFTRLKGLDYNSYRIENATWRRWYVFSICD